MKHSAIISAINRHRFEIDGVGIRTLVVFAGCPLRCKYCINPQTWDDSYKGVIYTPEKLLHTVSVDSIYFQATRGGITFGGGEPLLHSEFISEFISIAPSSWNYVVETSLAVPFDNVKLIANKVSRFVVDIKSMDEHIYHAYTGGDLTLAKNNLIALLDLVGAERVTVRVPIIPGYADVNSQRETIAALKELGVNNIDPFNYVIKHKSAHR